MKVKTPQISWHQREPIFSLDFHPSGRLATAGADNDIKIWQYDAQATTAYFTFLSSLNRHLKAVNVVRFSPDGEMLASGSDDANVLVWHKAPAGSSVASSALSDSVVENLEHWNVLYFLRGHLTDIYDLAWSPNSLFILSASTDNSVIVWDVKKSRPLTRLQDHTHYVQGVAWDPLDHYIATLSSDRTMRIYTNNIPASLISAGPSSGSSSAPAPGSSSSLSQPAQPSNAETPADAEVDDPMEIVSSLPSNALPSPSVAQTSASGPSPASKKKKEKEKDYFTCEHVVSSREYPASVVAAYAAAKANLQQTPTAEGQPGEGQEKEKGFAKRHKMFADETTNTFFRRLSFSVDGSLLIAPVGIFKADPDAAPQFTTYLFARNSLQTPFAHLLASTKPTIAVRCCPLRFQLRASENGQSTTTESASASSSSSSSPSSSSSTSSSSSRTPMVRLPYRMIFAVATLDSVLLYDTEQLHPVSMVQGIHYAELTDIAWTCDGSSLLISSKDGYCTILQFSPGELGVPYVPK